MAEYIEREAAVKICADLYKSCLRKNDWCGDTVAWDIGFQIKGLPAADVVKVVRCKDCKHYAENPYVKKKMCFAHLLTPHPMLEDAFCSLGERKDEK